MPSIAGSRFTCRKPGCGMQELPWLSEKAWNIVNRTADWSRVRETAKEKPDGEPCDFVVAFSDGTKMWCLITVVSVKTHPKFFTHWHYPAPIPPKPEAPKPPPPPSKYHDWCDAHGKDPASDYQKRQWNRACDLLGRPEEKA